MWICFITEPAKLYFDVIVYVQGCEFMYLEKNLRFHMSFAFSSPSHDFSAIKIRFLGEGRLVYLDLISFLLEYNCLHDLIILKFCFKGRKI